MSQPRPKIGTPEFELYAAGAMAEYDLTREGMSKSGLEVFSFVKEVAKLGGSRNDVIEYAIAVYGPSLPLRTRWALAWALIRGYR